LFLFYIIHLAYDKNVVFLEPIRIIIIDLQTQFNQMDGLLARNSLMTILAAFLFLSAAPMVFITLKINWPRKPFVELLEDKPKLNEELFFLEKEIKNKEDELDHYREMLWRHYYPKLYD
jgi:hypothetical protein